MAERSSVDTAASLVTVGVGGFLLFQLVQRLRYRATRPGMEDPGGQLVRRLQWVTVALAAVVAIAAVGLLAWLGPVAVILVVFCVVIAVVGGIAAAILLWLAAEQRRRTCRYVICEADYANAPRQIKAALRRIYKSARSVRSGAAYQRDMFGDLGIDQVVYSAAERAILSSELAAAARDLRPDAKASDQALLDDVNEQIRTIKDELASIRSGIQARRKICRRLVATSHCGEHSMTISRGAHFDHSSRPCQLRFNSAYPVPSPLAFQPSVNTAPHATAARAPKYTSVGIACRNRQVIAIGRSPSWDT